MVYTFRIIGARRWPSMPWSETSTMDQKRLFIRDYVRGSFSIAELCRRYEISRPTGYK
jgi:hypothetical protein